jgi:hypothetical protein
MHAYRDWSDRLILFEGADLSTPVERTLVDGYQVMPLILRPANRKSVPELHNRTGVAACSERSDRIVDAHLKQQIKGRQAVVAVAWASSGEVCSWSSSFLGRRGMRTRWSLSLFKEGTCAKMPSVPHMSTAARVQIWPERP